MIVAVANDTQFARFAEIIGLGQLAEDARFQTNAERVRNRLILLPLISEQLLKKTTREWLTEFDQAKIPAGPVNTIDAVFDDPQIKARNLVVEFPPGNRDPISVTGNPIHFSRTPVSYEKRPPELGEHTDEILSQVLHRSWESIRILRQNGVI